MALIPPAGVGEERSPTADPVNLKTRLVEAALDLLEASNAAPSLRAVARAVGVSAMTPYSHFADKAALMEAVANEGFGKMIRTLQSADQRDDPAEALVAQGLAFVAFAQANPALFRLIYSHEYGHARTEVVMRAYDVLQARVASVISSQVSAGTLACRALVQGMAAIVLDDRLQPSCPEDIEIAVRLLVGGLALMNRTGSAAPPT